jgi:hypothetical protein
MYNVLYIRGDLQVGAWSNYDGAMAKIPAGESAE